MHFWNVWHEGESFDSYYNVKPRFCSEFGYQAFLSYPLVLQYMDEDGVNSTSPLFENHQKNSRENSIIIENLCRYFRLPRDIPNLLYLSQVQQAMAVRTAVDYWRILRPECMGTLFWQLNDVWPACSWSSIDYDGRWRLLHYEARRFFTALRFMAFIKDGIMEFHSVNDNRGFRDFSGFILEEGDCQVQLSPGDTRTLFTRVAVDLPREQEFCFSVRRRVVQ